MAVNNHTAGALRPPLTYRITPRQWLAVDIAAGTLGLLVISFGLRVVHGPASTCRRRAWSLSRS